MVKEGKVPSHRSALAKNQLHKRIARILNENVELLIEVPSVCDSEDPHEVVGDDQILR